MVNQRRPQPLPAEVQVLPPNPYEYDSRVLHRIPPDPGAAKAGTYVLGHFAFLAGARGGK